MPLQRIQINSDGGARGNPGPAAIGVVIKDDGGKLIHKIGQSLGRQTNNQAEYMAVIIALEWLSKNQKKPTQADFYLDSELVVKQLNGDYKVKNEDLFTKYSQIKQLIQSWGQVVSFNHVPRIQNKDADKIVNQVLDQEVEIR